MVKTLNILNPFSANDDFWKVSYNNLVKSIWFLDISCISLQRRKLREILLFFSFCVS